MFVCLFESFGVRPEGLGCCSPPLTSYLMSLGKFANFAGQGKFDPSLRGCFPAGDDDARHLLIVRGAGAVGDGGRGSETGSRAVGRRPGSGSLHLTLGVGVHEARVAGEVLGRRRRERHGDGVGFRSSGHDGGGDVYR